MSGNDAEVLLITADARLREVVGRCRPADVHLHCVTPSGLAAAGLPTACELWIDLDCASGLELPPVSRRIYFHSRRCRPPEDAAPGLFIRKPCAETVVRILWAGVERVRAEQVRLAARRSAAPIPHWLLDFHELGLRELCRKCVQRLPARLGYGEVSMYLHDPKNQVLTLAETSHTRSIDLAVRMDNADRHLMVAVARSGKHLDTRDAAREWAARGLQRFTDQRGYPDGACLIGPLVSGGRLWGVLNFSRRQPTESTDEDVPLATVFAFLGRALRYARAYERARTEARVDPLTGLYNHRWMIEALTKEIRRGQRFKTPLAVVVADLDGLKTVNDRHGHAAGDSLLQHVAGRITTALRQFDSAARVGGDEFVILLPATDLDGARSVARRVLESIRSDAAVIRGAPVPIGASLGVAQWQPNWNATEMIDAADQAMYQAKRQGHGQLVCRPHEAPAAVHLAAGSSQRVWPPPEPREPAAEDPRTPEPTTATPHVLPPAARVPEGQKSDVALGQ